MRFSRNLARTGFLITAMLSMSACVGNNFEDFNSWYGNAAYSTGEKDMANARAEIARLKQQQQRYADIQTVPTRASYVQQAPAAQPAPERRYDELEERSDNRYYSPYGPLNPAGAHSAGAGNAFETASASAHKQPNLWQGIWPASSAR